MIEGALKKLGDDARGGGLDATREEVDVLVENFDFATKSKNKLGKVPKEDLISDGQEDEFGYMHFWIQGHDIVEILLDNGYLEEAENGFRITEEGRQILDAMESL